ncbi:hypothetical protein [Candidatus Nanohalococcus occultus]|uniref:hypothetical protein n=1 Tax=Candidatus Nanohalococcus occultus TaxID=2978047 RepID=UPI0039E17BD0
MDWIDELPERERNSLESLLDSVNKHDNVYMQAENASVGQIWVAMTLLNQRMEKLESLVKAQRKALNEMNVEVDVDKHLSENLENSLRNY